MGDNAWFTAKDLPAYVVTGWGCVRRAPHWVMQFRTLELGCTSVLCGPGGRT